MSGRHTPEPWRLRPAPADCIDVVPPGALERPSSGSIARVKAGSGGIPVQANAERIVACVNACAGIPTIGLQRIEALEPYLRLLKLSHLADRQAATFEGHPDHEYVAAGGGR